MPLFGKRPKRRGIIAQTYMLVFAGIVILGVFTYVTQYQLAKRSVQSQTKTRVTDAIGELAASFREYPTYRWLLSYWAEHSADMDVEYDADYAGNTETKEKYDLLMARNPDLSIRYCDEEQLAAMSPEDQKLYAELVYSWMITRIDAIKQNFGCAYLFCVMTDTDEGENPFGTQLFLMSGADPGAVRGTEYEQVYTLGVKVDDLREGTKEAMREAVEAAQASEDGTAAEIVGEKMINSGKYLDFYYVLELLGEKAVLIGATYYQGHMLERIRITTLLQSMTSMLYQILLISLVMRVIFLFMLRPLKEVLRAIRSYTASKDSRAMEADMDKLLSGKNAFAIKENEIGQLTEDMVDLAHEIDDYTKQIETAAAARERIEYELETAARIQAHMLPEAEPMFPEHPEFNLCASMTPAREVGGDFYDFFPVDEHHLALVIADVSDKGVPAALFMAQTKALIRSRAMTGEEPAEILAHVNDQLNEDHDSGWFVTVWMAVIDLRTGEGIAANAGHEHPALCRKGGKFELVIYKHDPVIGMIENLTFRQHTFTMNPGDRLFVYTDGVPEAGNAAKEQFGIPAMLDALNSCPDAKPQELLQRVSDAVDAFMGDTPRFDDTTMMCLYFTGSQEKQLEDNKEDQT